MQPGATGLRQDIHGHRASKVALCQLSAFRTQFYTPSKKTAYRRERAAVRSSSCKCRGGKGGQINTSPASPIAHTQVPKAVATQSLLRAECPKPHRTLAVGCDTRSYHSTSGITIRSPGQMFSDLGRSICPAQHRTMSGHVSSPSDSPRPCQLPCADSPHVASRQWQRQRQGDLAKLRHWSYAKAPVQITPLHLYRSTSKHRCYRAATLFVLPLGTAVNMSLLRRPSMGLLQDFSRGCKNPKMTQYSKRSQVGLYAGKDIR